MPPFVEAAHGFNRLADPIDHGLEQPLSDDGVGLVTENGDVGEEDHDVAGLGGDLVEGDRNRAVFDGGPEGDRAVTDRLKESGVTVAVLAVPSSAWNSMVLLRWAMASIR